MPLLPACCIRAAVVCCSKDSSQPGFLVLQCSEVPMDAHAMPLHCGLPDALSSCKREYRAGRLQEAAVVDSCCTAVQAIQGA